LIPAEVRMISGCHSEQTSVDLSNVGTISTLPNPAGRAGGACTSALLNILYLHHYHRGGNKFANNGISFQDILLQLRESLSNSGISQIPQLTSSRPLDLQRAPFRLRPQHVGGVARAVLVGINYVGQSGQLSGCHNDVLNVKRYIMDVHGYRDENIVVLMDKYGGNMFPSRQKIIEELRRLVAASRLGDSVYFHYSGHGGLLSPEFNAFKTNRKEYDEIIYPVDHHEAGQIRDFSLFNHFVKPMSAGVTVTCVMDCCHSGSVLDLPYSFRPTPGGEIRMRQSTDHLQNLAFLFMMAGGVLPDGFENILSSLGAVVGDISEYFGEGLEHLMHDGVAPEDVFAHLHDALAGGIPAMEGLNIDRESLPNVSQIMGVPGVEGVNIPDFGMPSEGYRDFAGDAADQAADNCDGCGAIGRAEEEDDNCDGCGAISEAQEVVDCGCVADLVSSILESGKDGDY